MSLCEDADGALGVSANNLVGVQGNVTAELGQGCADIVVVSLRLSLECDTSDLLLFGERKLLPS